MKDNDRELISHFIGHIYRLGSNYLTKEYTPYSIGFGQYQFLLQLYHKNGLSHEELTARLLVDKSTTTRAITKLYHAGYVDMAHQSTDKRKYEICLTDKAKEKRNEVLSIADQWEEQLTECLDSQEKDLLYHLLKKIALHNTQEKTDFYD